MSAQIRARRLRRSFGNVVAVADVDLDIAAGSLVSVVGPSGSGKTTLLRLLAGLETADAGEIYLDDEPLRGGPRERPTAMVFQQESLFPDLNVAENIAFGLRVRGHRAGASSEQVAVAMLRLGLTGLEDRFPDELSGGQRRRVAIARALVAQPRVLLLDEPLAGLDQSLARQILGQIRQTHRRLGLTTLLVTHNQEHALMAADQVLLLANGRVVQTGSPREVFDRPATIFAAEFWGRSSFVPVSCESITADQQAEVVLFGRRRLLPAHRDLRANCPATVMIRPHALQISAAEPDQRTVTGWPRIIGDQAIVQETYFYGDRIEYLVETELGVLAGTGSLDAEVLAPLASVRLKLDEARVWVLPST